MPRRKKTNFKRGQCNVTLSREKLRISIPFEIFHRKNVYIHSGLTDEPHYRTLVQSVCDQMNRDIVAKCFDLSLSSYKSQLSLKDIAAKSHENHKGSVYGVTPTKLIEVWRAWVESRYIPDETYNNHHRWVERWIKELNPEWDDTSWVFEINNQASTVNSYLGYVRSCVDWALVQGLIKGTNPYKSISIKSESIEEKRKGFTLTEKIEILEEFLHPTHQDKDEAEKIYWHYSLVYFCFKTGVRPGEAIGIKWRDIDIESGKVTIRRSRSRDLSNSGNGYQLKEKTTKTGKTRTLEIGEQLKQELTNLRLATFNRPGLVFTNLSGSPIDLNNWRRRVWYPALKRAGVEKQPPKNMRHTLITEAANDPKIGIVGASKIAGHTTTKTVQKHYIDLHGIAKLPE